MFSTPYKAVFILRRSWWNYINWISPLWIHSPLWLLLLQAHLSCDSCAAKRNVLTAECTVKHNDTAVLTAVARGPVVYQLWGYSLAMWTANMNHITCHSTLLQTWTSRGFLSPCVLPIGSPPRRPFYLSLPIQLSHRLVPTPLAWLGGRVFPFVHSHPHGRGGTTYTQRLPVFILSLIRAQLAGSRHGPCSCSHTPAVMTSPLSAITALCLILALCLSLFIMSFLTFFVVASDISFITEAVSCRLCPAGQTERLHDGGRVSPGRGDIKKWEELIWVSKHLIKKLPPSEALQAACGVSGAELLSSSSGNESF